MELRWNWKRADMVGFAVKVDNLRSMTENYPKSSIEARVTHLNRIILESAASSIGKVKTTPNGKQWDNEGDTGCDQEEKYAKAQHHRQEV